MRAPSSIDPAAPSPIAADALYASRAVVESIPAAAVIVADRSLRCVHVEGTLFARHGYDLQLAGRRLCDALPAEAWRELGPHYQAALDGSHRSFDYWNSSRTHAYWVQIAPVRGEDGAVTSVVAVIQDITDRARVNEALARSEARLREAERMVGVGSFELALGSGAITSSVGFRRLLGLAPDAELDLTRYWELVHPEDRAGVQQTVADLVRDGGEGSAEYRIVRADGVVRTLLVQGEILTDDDGRATTLQGAALDVTDQRQLESARLEAESLFRRGFDDAPIGMTLVEPGHGTFLEVNDAMCRLVGRSRAELVGTTIETVTHPEDRGAVQRTRQALADGSTAYHQFEKRYLRPDGTTVWVSVHATPVRRGDGTVRAFFGQIIDITERKRREAQLERDLAEAGWLGRVRDALDGDRLVLHGQPIVDLRTGETVQQELLLRMRGDDGSLIYPGDFLAVAERYGLIAEIDRWVIRQAVALAADGVRAEFNLSSMSIGDPAVIAELESALATSGADPSLLVVEVTETAMMDRLEAGCAFAERLAALGCGLALDDFGTGFSGLTHLKYLPAEHLKIDIEFVRDVTRSDAGGRMVRAIVGLAREFGLTTTAEGVEDEETAERLRRLGVDRAQGYLFGRPGPLTSRPRTARRARVGWRR